MTEFGANSVEAGEAGQARMLPRLWDDLRRGGAIGGVAFAFADEWWKNYDNPRAAGTWWSACRPRTTRPGRTSTRRRRTGW